jgi:octopine oxidase subunit A
MSRDARLGDAHELVVVGAGPAGLAAAATAAGLGIDTALLDEQTAPGGQIFRAIRTAPLSDPAILGAAYWRGKRLVDSFQTSGARYVPGASVWSVAAGREQEVGLTLGGAARVIQAGQVILATGALERPFPIPGWTLPGVLGAGAAQTLLKSAAMVPTGRVVLAGTGPLLWLLAAQILRAGGQISTLLDTTPAENRSRALAHLTGFLGSRYFREGLHLLRAVRRKVRVVRRVTALAAHGGEKLSEVAFRRGRGAEERIAADVLLLHQGVAPDLNLAVASGCAHAWDKRQLAFVPTTDAWGASSVPGIAIAGDGAGIMGADAAAERGRLAALDAACRLGRINRAERDKKAGPVRKALAQALRGRPFLDAAFRPARAFRIPDGETIVCRCEEVTARQVREATALGCPGPNQLKAFLRAGMGPCQGRMCGLTVSELMANARGVPVGEIGYFRLRPPVKPLTLAELAELPTTAEAEEAVGR